MIRRSLLQEGEAVLNGITLRQMGEFEPGRLSAENMKYIAIQQVLQKLEKRFVPLARS